MRPGSTATYQGVPGKLGAIEQPPSVVGALLDVFQASLEHEQAMTSRLNDLSDQALSEKDHATDNLLQWFVDEQVEEEVTVEAIIAKVRLVKDTATAC